MLSLYLVTAFILLAYVLLMITFVWGWGKLEVIKPGKHEALSFFSILIPARNEQNSIIALLQDLKIQDYDASHFEIILIDDHSEDTTLQVCKKFKNNNPSLDIQILSLEHVGGSKKAALGLGYSAARGDAVITLDADCSIGPDYLKTINAYYRQKKSKLLLGPVHLRTRNGLFSLFQSLEFSSLIFSGAGSAGAGIPVMANGANMLVDRSVFVSTNPEVIMNDKYSSGDDMFLLDYVSKTFGAKHIHFAKNTGAIVKTEPAQSLKKFINQRIRWVSKSKGYKNPVQIFTSLIVLAVAFVQLLLAVTLLFLPSVFFFFLAVWIVKIAVDTWVLIKITSFLKAGKLKWWILPFSLLYPFYVVIIAILGLFWRYEWKGRYRSRK